MILFFLLSILEDTGYMARVAFVMDKLLRKIGLSGRSIVPLLIGFGWLLCTRTVELTIPLAYLSTVAAMSALCGQNVLTQLLSGGLLLGAFFMATDYTTSPFTRKGKLIFGVGCGLITCAIRFWGNMNEGVSYSILLMNLTVPYINAKTRKTPMGGGKRK